MIYTSICGNYDYPREDIKCFTAYDRFKDPRLNAKIYKVLSHLFIEDEWSVWIDGNVQTPMWQIEQWVEQVKHSGKSVGVFNHPYSRKCIYEEAEECKRLRLDDPKVIDEQMDRYRVIHPKNAGLAACTLIVRRHTDAVNRLNERWWAEICRGSMRDQLSFNYVFRDYHIIKGHYSDLKKKGHLKPREYDLLPPNRG